LIRFEVERGIAP